MYENPLLPHRKLQELYKLMERCRALERKNAPHNQWAREALLAATTIHLAPGDLLCGKASDRSAVELAPLRRDGSIPNDVALPTGSRLALAAAMARGLKVAGASGVVLVYATAGSTEDGWAEAMAWAQAERLPLVFAFADATTSRAPSKTTTGKALPLRWSAVERVANRLKLPTLLVDGEDAVAVYRVMQESVLRARGSIGPSLIWAALSPSGAKLLRTAKPVARLQRYLAARKIALPK